MFTKSFLNLFHMVDFPYMDCIMKLFYWMHSLPYSCYIYALTFVFPILNKNFNELLVYLNDTQML